MKDGQASLKEAREAAQWLRDYANDSIPFFWHGYLYFVHPPKETLLFVEEEMGKRDSEGWALFDPKSDASKRKSFCQSYIQTWPNGKHITAAKDELEKAVREITNKKFENRLNTLEKEFKQAMDENANDLDSRLLELQNIRIKIETPFTNEDRMNADVQKKKHDLLQRVMDAIVETSISLDWKTAKSTYFELMKDRKLLQAAKILTAYIGKQPEAKDLIEKDFKPNFYEILKEKIRRYVSEGNWPDAYNYIKELRADLPFQAKPTEGNYDAELDELKKDVEEKEDKHYYDKVLRRRSIRYVDMYLERAPVQAMKSYVAGYKKYLEDKKNPHVYKITFTHVMWNKRSQKANDIELNIHSPQDKTTGRFKSAPNKTLSISGAGAKNQVTFKRKLNGKVRIKISLWDMDFELVGMGKFFKDHLGTYDGTHIINELRRKKRLILKGGDFGTQEVRIEVTGGPQEPELPEKWKRPN
jgi:hypothetical protein